MEFDKKEYKAQFEDYVKDKRIKKSQQSFKIRLFLEKAENSLLIAKHTKDIQPSKDQPKKGLLGHHNLLLFHALCSNFIKRL